MGRGIFKHFYLVMRPGDNFMVINHHRTHRHFICSGGLFSLTDGFSHEYFIIFKHSLFGFINRKDNMDIGTLAQRTFNINGSADAFIIELMMESPKPALFSIPRFFGGKKRLKHFWQMFRRNPNTLISNINGDTIAHDLCVTLILRPLAWPGWH